MIRLTLFRVGISLLAGLGSIRAAETNMPKPEHPRPDAMREPWANLNGSWEFRFDAGDQGTKDGWEKPDAAGCDKKTGKALFGNSRSIFLGQNDEK